MSTSYPLRRCPSCREWWPETARFCGTCGAAQPEAPIDASKRAPGEAGFLGRGFSLSGVALAVAFAVPLVIGAAATDWNQAAARLRPAPKMAAATVPERQPWGGDHLTCPLCEGSGLVDHPIWSDMGGGHWNHIPVACPRCKGMGWIFRSDAVEYAPRFRY